MYSQTWKTEGLGEQFVVRCDDYISFLFKKKKKIP